MKVIAIRSIKQAEQAFAECYRTYFERVKAYSCEDTAQDIFLKLWLRRDRIVFLTSPEKYLFRMAKNRMFDLRHAQERRQEALSHLEQSGPAYSEVIGEEISFRETQRLVQAVVIRLPARTQHVFSLRQGGLKMTEIADRVGITKRSVTNHMGVADAKIKKCLGV